MCIRDRDYVLTEEVKKNAINYVDDMLCFSNNEQEHIVHLENLLNNLKNANMTVGVELLVTLTV